MARLEGLHTKIHLKRRTSSESTATIITSRVSLNTAIYIHKESSDMAQNNDIVVYGLLRSRRRVRPIIFCLLYSLESILIDAPIVNQLALISWLWASPITP